VTDLQAADFEVLDRDVAQSITDLSYGKLPIDVTVALDLSSSVTGTVLEDLRQSVQQLGRDLRPGDRLKLVTFNMKVKRVIDFTDHPDQALAALRQSGGAGSTAIFDTLAVELAGAAPPDRRRLVLVFSDGDDNASTTDVRTLLDVAKRTTPTVGVVLEQGNAMPFLGSTTMASGVTAIRTSNAAALANATALRQFYTSLTQATGGIVIPVTSSSAVSAALRRLLDEFRSSYVLHFVPQGVDRVGFHALTVRVTRRGGPYDVRARSGYEWR
jgi:VWFA-related protein